METLNLRVTAENSKVEELYYCVSLKTPAKPELLNLIPYHLQKLEQRIKFKTGILGTLEHSIVLCLFRECNEPKLCIFISLEKSQEQLVELRAIEISFSTGNEQNNMIYSMTRRFPPQNFQIPENQLGAENLIENNQCWMASSEWPNDTTNIFITFNIVSRYPPEIINEEEDVFPSFKFPGGSVNIEDYFMNGEFSDFTIICQQKAFPVHRIILSSRVKYFQAMLSSNMRESQEGTLTMDDVSPATCTELLRFIYQGRVENLSTIAQELFVIADKYGMTDLQNLCERYLYRNMSIGNALEVYELSPTLTKKAKDIILSNKSKFAPDPEALKNFTCKHPDLVFELFRLC